jgi:hypothetical protein
MGMITKCYPGNDGVVRVVDVKTMYGEYKGPVVKLMKIDVTKLGIGEENEQWRRLSGILTQKEPPDYRVYERHLTDGENMK